MFLLIFQIVLSVAVVAALTSVALAGVHGNSYIEIAHTPVVHHAPIVHHAVPVVHAPIHHEDPAHLHLTGTGLTHLGSAATRDAMHAKAGAEDASDSLKMFRMGLEGGKPESLPGAQPEWFYKGDGQSLVGPGAPLTAPAFALDGGEEPELAGIYLIGDDGTPYRLGFALANEFSDHVTERQNYLFLAHSKLRPAAYGPELLLGELPAHVGIVATHPLFGPQSARNGIAGLKVAVCPVRGGDGPRVGAFLRRALGLQVIMTTPDAHDREAAMVQGLTHLIAKVLVPEHPRVLCEL